MKRPTLHSPVFERIHVRDGVVLRPLESADASELLAILDADPSIRERVGVASRLYKVEDIAKLLEDESSDEELVRYAIVENNRVVGMVNFWRAGEFFGDKADPDDYGFGYFLAPSARGRGLVTDSLSAIMAVASTRLHIKRFIAFCEADNAASGAVLKKAGFEKTAMQWKDDEHGWLEQKYARSIPEHRQL
jgi:RimJ/RimL family protein N-acetyltransferase